jgi:ubiquinone/menaquinone biosynthesis C-methylase UbiE
MEPDRTLRTVYRVRVALFLVFVVFVIAGLTILFQGIATLRQLDLVERERDTWQKPLEILQALDARQGSTVADIGCGSGYFTLKLSPLVGNQGRVLAEDIRRESLLFLWIRSLRLPAHNVSVIHGLNDNPRLGTVRLDAAIISNTYHEFINPGAILSRTYRSLRSGGRLVVVDRGPNRSSESRDLEMEHHEISLVIADREIRQSGFEIVREQDRFINRPGTVQWWLIVAVKP